MCGEAMHRYMIVSVLIDCGIYHATIIRFDEMFK